ncbi:MAG TPA: preprotein translocase subunit YajC [Candidatus Binataceae bacterium]|nr:preprotein translocase subunit YajC [Candidatus Binataceae bacterium]
MFEGIAWAAGAAPPQSMFDTLIANPLVPLALVVAVFYFVILRPQTKKASQHQSMLKALKRNDEIVTTGGLIGRIAELNDNVVTMEIAPGVRVRVERSQVSAISSYGKTPSKKEKSE